MTPFRTLSVTIACIVLAAVTTRTALRPKIQEPSYEAFTFPKTVPLSQWQSISTSNATNRSLNNLLFANLSSTDLSSSATFSGDIAAHQQYQYQKDNQYLTAQQLTIDIRYLVSTNGNLKGLITEEISLSSTNQQQASTQRGYSLISHKGYAYLNTCQNARGAATLSTDQFNRNRLIYDLRPSRILPWLQGKDTLPDQRCLWTQIAVSLANYESESEAYEAIEATWAEWANWWQPNFPAH